MALPDFSYDGESKTFLYESLNITEKLHNAQNLSTLIELFNRFNQYEFVTHHSHPRYDAFWAKPYTDTQKKLTYETLQALRDLIGKDQGNHALLSDEERSTFRESIFCQQVEILYPQQWREISALLFPSQLEHTV